MLAPQTTPVAPNAVFCPSIITGCQIVGGKLQGCIRQCVVAGANVDANGKWTAAGPQANLSPITFSFDVNGNVTGLPADLAGLAADVGAAWAAIEKVVGEINAIRKVI